MAWKMVTRIKVTRIIAIVSVLLACAIAAATLAVRGADSPPRPARAVLLSSGSGFDLSGTVGDLAPGLTSSLVLRVTNPNSFPITLRTVEISVGSEPVGCPSASLTIAGQAFSGSPPAMTVTGLSTVVPAYQSAAQPLTILLDRSAGNRCQHVTFPFQYLGTATGLTVVTELATITTLTSSPNPSRAGRQFTFTARVRAASATGARPTGWVTFWRCRKPAHLPPNSFASACRSATRAGRPAPVKVGVARLVLRHLTAGSRVYFASFSPFGIQFARSNSRTITQRIICPRKVRRCR